LCAASLAAEQVAPGALLHSARLDQGPSGGGPRAFFVETSPDFTSHSLWVTDGSPEGTRAVPGICDPGCATTPLLRGVADGTAFVVTFDPVTSAPTVTHTDGTATGSQVVYQGATLLEAAGLAGRRFVFVTGDFVAPFTLRHRLWASDGSAAVEIADLAAIDPQGTPRDLLADGERVWMVTDSGTSTRVLVSDGTAQGTEDLGSAPRSSSYWALTPAGLLVEDSVPGSGAAFWRFARGSSAPLRLVLPTADPLAGVAWIEPTPVGGILAVRDGDSVELWSTDGTLGGARQLDSGHPLNPEIYAPLSRHVAFFRERYYYFGGPDATRVDLVRFDPSTGSTDVVDTICQDDSGCSDLGHLHLTPTGEALLYPHKVGAGDYRLRRTRGGLGDSEDLFAGAAGVQPSVWIESAPQPFEGYALLSAFLPATGQQFWLTDGERSVRISSLPEGAYEFPDDSSPAPIARLGQKLIVATAGQPVAIWAADLGAVGGSCWPSSRSLCLQEGRFQLSARWRDFAGGTGEGIATTLTADTGHFWFFDPANVEIVAKVLDGRGVNAAYWVFYGALSNVEFTLEVVDSFSGEVRRYRNPSGTYASIGDTGGFGPFDSTTLPAAAEARPALPLSTSFAAEASDTCTPSATRLCLQQGRFAVEATWRDFEGHTGIGTAVPLSADTGYFWFFWDANVEVILKVLDGRPVNDKFWVYYGALSNVEYTLTVTDTLTGDVKTYFNPAGRFASVGDNFAF